MDTLPRPSLRDKLALLHPHTMFTIKPAVLSRRALAGDA
jgi:hypothetical protein